MRGITNRLCGGNVQAQNITRDRNVRCEHCRELLSAESLRKTGYFDPAAVQSWRQAFTGRRLRKVHRMSVEMGLAAVLTTQLWHHTFIDGTLADLPSQGPAGRPCVAV